MLQGGTKTSQIVLWSFEGVFGKTKIDKFNLEAGQTGEGGCTSRTRENRRLESQNRKSGTQSVESLRKKEKQNNSIRENRQVFIGKRKGKERRLEGGW